MTERSTHLDAAAHEAGGAPDHGQPRRAYVRPRLEVAGRLDQVVRGGSAGLGDSHNPGIQKP